MYNPTTHIPQTFSPQKHIKYIVQTSFQEKQQKSNIFNIFHCLFLNCMFFTVTHHNPSNSCIKHLEKKLVRHRNCNLPWINSKLFQYLILIDFGSFVQFPFSKTVTQGKTILRYFYRHCQFSISCMLIECRGAHLNNV